MSTIIKERVAGIASGEKCYTHDDVVELSRIALASLEAEPVAFRSKLKSPSAISSERWDYTDHRQPDAFEFESCLIERLYTAPPAPVSVPAAYEHTEDFSEYHEGWNACRTAMLHGAEHVSNRDELPYDPQIAAYEKIMEQAIPDGWVMVPVELTGAMTNAMTDAILDDLHNVDVWRSVLAAAPHQEDK